MSDGDLVRQILMGQTASYDELVRRWSARVLAFCHAKVGSAHVAEDLAQEALMRGFRGLATLAEPEKFGAWLRGIALRVCLDWRKSKQSKQVTFATLGCNCSPDEFLAVESPRDEPEVDHADELRHLMAAVEALPEDFREVIMLYYYQDVTYCDLAQTLAVSPATINARLTKARAMLRERMTASRR